uniref:Aquaporin 9 n=1 Tax=Chelydra serpentina TaxID=8475 RepID=A0A8C3S635_CHESE
MKAASRSYNLSSKISFTAWCQHASVLPFPSELQALGCGSVAQAVLSRGAMGGTVTVSVGFAMAVTMAVYVSGGVSGGHINPAVSLAMCATGRLKWTKLPFYILAQFLGAFVGAAAVFGIYYDAFMNYSGGELIVTGSNATAHIFATYPAPHLSLISGFADQPDPQLMQISTAPLSPGEYTNLYLLGFWPIWYMNVIPCSLLLELQSFICYLSLPHRCLFTPPCSAKNFDD